MPKFANLPQETLEEIVDWIDSRHDLYSLALTARIFNRIISPRHVQYRDIRCRLDTETVWKQLGADRSLARNVRSVEMQREEWGFIYRWPDALRIPDSLRPPLLPVLGRDITQESLDEQRDFELQLIAAIRNTSNLASFAWNRAPPLIDSLSSDAEEDIWTALRRCSGLKELEFVDASEDSPVHCTEWSEEEAEKWAFLRPIWDSAVFEISGLTSFKAMSYAYGRSQAAVDMLRLQDMLVNRCPDLEVLDLSVYLRSNPIYDTANGDRLLEAARWAQLRTLRLDGVECSAVVAATFFSEHPTIHNLEISQHFFHDPDLTLPVGTLPQLRYLRCTLEQALVILRALPQSPQVRRIQLTDPLGERDKDDFFQLLRRLPRLERLELGRSVSPGDIKRIAGTARGLNWLRVDTTMNKRAPKKEWIAAFALFPQLATLDGFDYLIQKPQDEDDPNLLSILTQLPNLKRLKAWPSAVGRGYYRPVLLLNKDPQSGTLRWTVRETTRDGDVG